MPSLSDLLMINKRCKNSTVIFFVADTGQGILLLESEMQGSKIGRGSDDGFSKNIVYSCLGQVAEKGFVQGTADAFSRQIREHSRLVD